MKEDVGPDILDDESIYRAIFTPYHYDVKKKKLKRQAFIQKPHSKGVSSYRGAILEPNEVRDYAKQLGQDTAQVNPDKKYHGICVCSAGAVRKAGSNIVDSRALFYGHADIFHSIPDAEPGEPNSPEDTEKLQIAIDKILECTNYFIDTNPEGEVPVEMIQLKPKC